MNQSIAKTKCKKAIDLLYKTNLLLKEEKTRWKILHSNPTTDKCTVVSDNSNLYISIFIDTSVSNIINSKPITRKYVISKTLMPEHTNYNILMGTNVSSTHHMSPAILFIYTPKKLYNIGIGSYISTNNLGVAITYTFKNVYLYTFSGANKNFTFDYGIGISLKIF